MSESFEGGPKVIYDDEFEDEVDDLKNVKVKSPRIKRSLIKRAPYA